MNKSKELFLSIKLLVLFLVLVFLVFGNTVKVFANNILEDNLYCKVDYIASTDSGRQRIYYEFKTESEYLAWSKEICGEYIRDYNLYLCKDNAKASLIETDSYSIFANNHSFDFVDSHGNSITNLSIRNIIIGDYAAGGALNIYDCPSINPNVVYNVEENMKLRFSNCTIDGKGSSYSSDVFNICKGGNIAFYETEVKNFKLIGNTELVDFVNEGSSGKTAAVLGDEKSGFVNISAEQKGIMRLDYGEASVSNLYFNNCDSNDCAGALYVNYGDVYNCSFNDCDSGEYGGAIYIEGSDVRVNKCSFANCSCNKDGGAVYINGKDATIVSCFFNDNISDVDGGAICVKGDDCYIGSSSFTRNHAKDDGGAIYVCASQDNCEIYGCSFSENKADDACDNIDGNSDTYITGQGAIISNGSLAIIIVVSAILVLCVVGVVLFKFRDKLFQKKSKEE